MVAIGLVGKDTLCSGIWFTDFCRRQEIIQRVKDTQSLSPTSRRSQYGDAVYQSSGPPIRPDGVSCPQTSVNLTNVP